MKCASDRAYDGDQTMTNERRARVTRLASWRLLSEAPTHDRVWRPSVLRRLVAAGLSTCALGSGPALAEGQTLRAVLVHSEGSLPRILHTDTLTAPCFWAVTYNIQGAGSPDTSSESRPAITLSFFTTEDWASLVQRQRRLPSSLTAAEARFHTRVTFGDSAVQPVVESRKSLGLGSFGHPHNLARMSEWYLAAHNVPTRLVAGVPAVRRVLPSDTAGAPGLERLREVCPLPPGVQQ